MQDGVETVTAELSNLDDQFASSANLITSMFDQALTAAIRTAQWAHLHTNLYPDEVKTKFGLHHVAPPRTNSATYRSRQQGETLLVQQEQVEEDKSRLQTKNTELYYGGRMYALPDILEMIGNFFALMCLIIEYNPKQQPVLWLEIVKIVKIFRTLEGRKWCDIHRHSREIMFNVVQDIQSTIAGFVNEARKQGYKKLVSTGTTVSAMIFTDALKQSTMLRNNLQGTVFTMGAGTYKDSQYLYKFFNPEEEKKRKRGDDEAASGTSPPSTGNRQRTNGTNRTPSNRSNTVTPGGSPGSSANGPRQGPPGKTVFAHESATPPLSLPHPGAIFPNAARQGSLTLMCCRSAYAGRDCNTPNCSFYHFPSTLSSVPRELKEKLKTWVSNTALVQWHGDAINWANPGNVTTSRPPSTTTR